MKLKKAENLSERLYAELRGRLQRGEVGPEQRFVDVEIAAAYGTSRMPVREALLRLVNEGLLEGSTRGFRVPTLSDSDIRDVFEIRRLLEPEAAAKAARDLPPRSAVALDEALGAARRAVGAGDAEALMLANVAFRAAWLGAVRNARLVHAIARFADHAQAVRAGTLRDAPTRTLVLEGLEALHRALTQRDPDAARSLMAAFVSEAERRFFLLREAEGAGVSALAAQ